MLLSIVCRSICFYRQAVSLHRGAAQRLPRTGSFDFQADDAELNHSDPSSAKPLKNGILKTINDYCEQERNGVIAHFEEANPVQRDMLVGAGGSGSFVRQQLMPEVRPRYAGYVAWRGVVPESSASPNLIKTFVDCFTFQQMKRSHILCYLIPGADGETEAGKRRLKQNLSIL